MTVWFLTVEMLHRSNQMEDHAIFMFLSVYLLAFPFASVTQDQHKQTGLQIVSGIYLAAALLLTIFSAFLIVGYFPGSLGPYLYWDGARLHAIHHPNITARILMISIALGMGFSAQAKERWIKALLLLFVVLLFFCMALTNSRACILITCLLLAGNVFFFIHNGTLKRFLLGAATAVLVMVLLYSASSTLFQWNSDRLQQQAAVTAEQAAVTAEQAQQQDTAPTSLSTEEQTLPEAVPLAEEADSLAEAYEKVTDDFFVSNQGSLLSDLFTLNSRTLIWTEVLRKIQNEPMILLWGTDSTQINGQLVSVDHTHNSWLEILLRLGLPGFVMSLYFTVQAAWSALCLLWHNSVDLWKKNIAMLSLCLLVTSMMEPLLFFTEEWAHFIDFIFFLTLGYLILWRKQLLRKP